MGPEVAQAVVGIGKAIQAGNSIKGTAKHVTSNIKKWNTPTKEKKTHFKKAGAKQGNGVPQPPKVG